MFGLTQRILVLDTETCSAVDLKKAGAHRYFADTSTRTLMVGFQYVGSPTAGLWQPHLGDPPSYLLEALQAPPEECLIAGYNMVFDGMAMGKLGLPVPLEKQLDIALLSYMLGFAGSLDQVLEQFEIPMRKSPEGRRLITTFSRMQKPWYQHPSEWEKFVRYCEQDVTVEVELLKKCARWLDTPALAPVVRQVQAQWLMDQRMNARGLPVDTATVDGALSILREETRRLTAWMKDATGLANPNSVQQLGAWLAAEGQPLPDLRAGTIIEALDQMDPGSTVYQVLEARQSLGRASVKKYAAMAASHVDGRLKGSVTTYGASRTGRTASRGINLANLERPKLRFTDEAADVMASGSHEAFKAFLDVFEDGTPVIQGLGSCVRGALKAPPGRGITAVDLKSIESVALAWACGCDTILDLFHNGRDTYKDFATRYYGIPYEEVTKKQRGFCKPPVLGCFADDTLVLTERGWVLITEVLLNDRVWDGVEWVNTGGVMYQGTKTILSRAGVRATPEHLVLQGSTWSPWEQLKDDFLRRDNSSACGLCSDTLLPKKHMRAYVKDVEELKQCRLRTSWTEGLRPVKSAITSTEASLSRLACLRKTVEGCLTGFTPRVHVARTRVIRNSKITAQEVSSVVSPASLFWSTLYSLKGGTTQSLIWTGRITTDTMRSVTSVLLLGLSKTAISALTLCCFLTGESTQQLSFIKKWLLDTPRLPRSFVKLRKDSLLKKYFGIKYTAQAHDSDGRLEHDVPVYDIVNAGPRHRYTILTAYGPQIVHNCGYGAAGEALVKYAKGMGVVMDKDTASEMVRVFRTEYKEIPAYWKKVEATVKEAIRNPKVMQYVYPEGREWPRVAYYYDGTFLFCGLPSGRTLFYFRPMISVERRRSNREGDPDWFSESISYMGKKQDAGGAWQRVFTHGGKLTENLIQAVCRDILYHGLALIDQDPEIELVGSLYDEVITLTPLGTDDPYTRICRYMETKPSWLDDRFFLGSDGYCNAGRYRK